MVNKFLDRSNYIRVPVSGLKLGMFVAELDRPWLETPFLMQGFTIRTLSEIRKLREYCDFVYVDKQGRHWGDKLDPFRTGFGMPKRSVDGAGVSGLQKRARKPVKEVSVMDSIQVRPEHKMRLNAEEEHPAAREAYKAAHQAVSGILDDARLGNALDTNAAKQVVTGCVESLLRNPAALMWMAKIKHADQYTMEHCLNVCILAIAFGRHLRLEEDELIKLGTGGMLHDVGKMQIPLEILNKPAKLSEEEFAQMMKHTEIGRNLLMKSEGSLSYAVDVAFNHHEQIDGQGYPRGLFAKELSQYSRIIAIVDAFDAMTSDRCYDKARSTLDALKEIYRQRGKQFDDELALEFIQLMGPYPPGTIVELNNGIIGIVLSSKERKRHLPQVRLVLDKDKQPMDEDVIDLLDVEKGTMPRDWLIRKVLKDGDNGIHLEEFPVRRALAGMANNPESSEVKPA